MLTINIPYCRENLTEEDAVLIPQHDSVSTSLVGDSEINRGWEEVSPEMVPDCIEFLDRYTSVRNTTEPMLDGGTAPCSYVKDPMANGETFPGIWRKVFVRRMVKGEVSYIVQTLRKGFLTTLQTSAGAVDWTEARLVETQHLVPGVLDPAYLISPETGGNTEEKYIVVKWENVSPYHVDSIEDFLNAQTVGGWAPIFKRAAYGTDWHRIYTASKINEDGSAVVTLFLAKPEYALYAFRSFRSLREGYIKYLWGVPKELAQEILWAERQKGRSASCSYDQRSGFVDIVIYLKDWNVYVFYQNTPTMTSCRAFELTSYYWGIENPNSFTIDAYTTDDGALQGRIQHRHISPNEDGSFDVVITVRYAKTRVITWVGAQESVLQDVDVYRTFNAYAITPDISQSPYANIQATMYRQNVQFNEDCTYDITTEKIKSEEVCMYVTWPSDNGSAWEYIYQNCRTAPDGVYQSLAANFYASRSNNMSFRENDDGTYEIQIRSQPRTVASSGGKSGDNFYFYHFELEQIMEKGSADFVPIPYWGMIGFYNYVKYVDSEESAYEEAFYGINPHVSGSGDTWRIQKTIAARRFYDTGGKLILKSDGWGAVAAVAGYPKSFPGFGVNT